MVDIRVYPQGPLGSVTYLLVFENQSLVIDPAVRPSQIRAPYPAVSHILATHGHIDHIAAADLWRQQTTAGLWIHAADADCLTRSERNLSALMGQAQTFQPADQLLADGQVLAIDTASRLTVWHTPGHSAGSVCLLLETHDKPVALFTGDTLFAGSIGRTDLGGDPQAMAASLKRLAQADRAIQDIPVYPGHGTDTRLHLERRQNPYWPADA